MSSTDDQGRDKAMDLAEESREKEWKFPSFVAEMFRGNFRWDMIHPFPEQDLKDKKIGEEFIEKVRVVLEKYLDPGEVDRLGKVPQEALDALAEIGCFGLNIPKKYGGLEMSKTNYSGICGYVSSYCASTAVWLSAHQSIGVPQPLKIFGTEEQRQRFLPRLAKGAVSAFALTEPWVGSDPARMTTKATPSDDGSYYLINGEKLWITNGPDAEILLVMALTPPKIVKGKERPQITAFIVESSMPGFSVASRCSFMGIRGISNGLLNFDNVKVPKENIVGELGQGLKIALTTLNTGRMTIPATSVAAGKACMHFGKKWVNERVQWGQPIGKHQAVGVRTAGIAANTFAMDSMNAVTCAFVDRGCADIRLEAAMAKLYCTETAWQLADDFLQVRGGRGYETAESLAARGEDPIAAERMLRDARISCIIEGTSEIMRLFIAREAVDMHFSLVMPIMTGKGNMPGLVWKAAKFYIPWLISVYLPANTSFNVQHLNAANRGHLAYVAKTCKRLARKLFWTMARYQQKLEREQLILQRFVDAGTDLFAMAAALSNAESLLPRVKDKESFQNLVNLFCTNARLRIERGFSDVKLIPSGLIYKVAVSYMEGAYDWMTDGVYRDYPPSLRPAAKREEASLGAAQEVPK